MNTRKTHQMELIFKYPKTSLTLPIETRKRLVDLIGELILEYREEVNNNLEGGEAKHE